MKEIINNQKTQLKCKSCGGNVVFSPEDKALKCVFCNSLQNIEYDSNFQKHTYTKDAENVEAYNSFTKDNRIFKCSSCGANIILNKLDISKKCPYCGGACVIKEEEIKALSPDAIIPFSFGKQKAVEYYHKGIKKKWFVPSKFKKQPLIDDMHGVYVPCFSFDADTETEYDGCLETDHTEGVGADARTYTTTEHISGTQNMSHKDILVETSSHLTQKVFNSIRPYKTSALVKYNSGFITGYSVEYYDENLNSCKKTADDIMEGIIKNEILFHYSYDRVRYYSQSTIFSNEMFAYYILPTYQINYRYKNKNYTNFMNGQTGRVGGSVPRSAVKITFFVLYILALLIGLGVLIYFVA